MVWASSQNVSWAPPFGRFQDTPNWDETLAQTQTFLERLYSSFGLRTPGLGSLLLVGHNFGLVGDHKWIDAQVELQMFPPYLLPSCPYKRANVTETSRLCGEEATDLMSCFLRCGVTRKHLYQYRYTRRRVRPLLEGYFTSLKAWREPRGLIISYQSRIRVSASHFCCVWQFEM